MLPVRKRTNDTTHDTGRVYEIAKSFEHLQGGDREVADVGVVEQGAAHGRRVLSAEAAAASYYEAGGSDLEEGLPAQGTVHGQAEQEFQRGRRTPYTT